MFFFFPLRLHPASYSVDKSSFFAEKQPEHEAVNSATPTEE
jgi:hypothetical protein